MIPLCILFVSATAAGTAAWVLPRRVPAANPASPRATGAVARGLEHEFEAHDRLGTFMRDRLNPQVATGLLLTAVLVLVTVLGILAFLVRSDSGLLGFDGSVEGWAREHTTGSRRDVVRAVTDLGGSLVITLVAVAVAVIELRRPPRRWLLPFLVVAIAGLTLVTNLIKLGVDRVRPELGLGLDASFPSGHSANAAVTFAAVALLIGRARSPRVQAALTGVAVGVAVAVGTSRILLGVHWVTDVIAGLALGWAWFAFTAVAFGGRLLRFGAPVEIADRHDRLVRTAEPSEPVAR